MGVRWLRPAGQVGVALAATAIWCWAAAGTPLGYDEFFTLGIARLPVRQMMAVLSSGLEPNPPLHYWLAAAGLATGAPVEVGLRLFSWAAFLGCALSCFALVRLETRRLAGAWLAPAILLLSLLAQLTLVARPMVLVAAGGALAWLAWEKHRRSPSLAWRALYVAGLAVAISSHYYGIILVGLLTLADLRHGWRRGYAYLPVAALLLLYLPWIRASQANAVNTWKNAPGYLYAPGVENFVSMLLSHGLPWILPLLVGLVLSQFFRPKAIRAAASERLDRGMLGAFLAFPLLIFLAGVMVTGVHFVRYGAPGLVGFAVAGALWAVAAGNRLQRPVAVASLVAALLLAVVWSPLRPAPVPAEWALLGRVPTGDIVMANPIDFPAASFYAAPAWRSRLTYLTDPGMVRINPDPIAEGMLPLLSRWMPMRLVPANAYLAHARPFTLLSRNHLSEWLPERLRRSGWRLRRQGCSGPTCAYRAEPPEIHSRTKE